MAKQILVLNGPNLNMLGTREPEIYGSKTLDDVAKECQEVAADFDMTVEFKQSNNESELVDWIQQARDEYSGIIINAGAYTHTSVAIRDALLNLDIPIIEVHISNIFKREEFRHHSYISDVAEGMICGLGTKGYSLAVQALANQG